MAPLLAPLLLAAWTSYAHAQTSAKQYETQCASADDYGWPRFHNHEELVTNKSWAQYFTSVFGALPTKFPVCVYDFWTINQAAYAAAGLSGSRPVVDPRGDLKEGDLYHGSLGGLAIYHGHWSAAPNNTWIEVSHAVLPTELAGSWAWRQRGSGVFYNTGRTIVFPTPSDMRNVHRQAIEFLVKGCSKQPSYRWPQSESDIFGFCAREKGYDSVQFEPNRSAAHTSTFGLTGLTELVMVNLDGDLTCGTPNASQTPLRVGWQAAAACNGCKNAPIPPNCGVMAKCPIAWWQGGCHPKICDAPPCSMTNCQQLAPALCGMINASSTTIGAVRAPTNHPLQPEPVTDASAAAGAARAEAAAAGATAWAVETRGLALYTPA